MTSGVLTNDSLAIAQHLREAYATHLSPSGGFLPPVVPLDDLPDPFASYVEACAELPHRFPTQFGGVRAWLGERFERHDPAVIAALDQLDPMQLAKLMTVLSVLGHTYRWDTAPPRPETFTLRHLDLPEGLDRLWIHLAALLQQPRVGTMWSLLLCNWKLETKPGGSAYRNDELVMDNLRLAHGWLPSPLDRVLKTWSVLFVEAEARGAVVIQDIVNAIYAAARQDEQHTTYLLDKLYDDTAAMSHVFMRTIRRSVIDPDAWRELIGPIYGWGLESAEGPLEGASGMQLGGFACLNVALGIMDESSLARSTLRSRKYMTEPQRQFLRALDEAGPIIRRFVEQSGNQILKHRFNDCVQALLGWRVAHQKRGILYMRGSAIDSGAHVSTGLTLAQGEDSVAQFETMASERLEETRHGLVETQSPVGLSLESAFRYLSEDERKLLLNLSKSRSYERDATILAAGTRRHGMFIVHQGTVRVEIGEETRTAVARLGPGDIFGEMAFLINTGASAWVVADEEVTVDVIDRDDLYALLDVDPALSSHFYQSLALVLAQRIREMDSLLLSMRRNVAMNAMDGELIDS